MKKNKQLDNKDTDTLSHVDKYWLSLTEEEREKHRQEVLKKSKRIKTPFGDFILFKV